MKPITGKTKLLGVIGDPIGHSLSPIMHNAALAEMGVEYAYLPFAIKPEDLEQAIAGFAAIDVRGFSVTIPHKQAIIPLLSETSELAQAIGAVNTVWRTEKGWSGTNTDIEGFLAPLHAMSQLRWSEATAVILGNGGAARAVVAGCLQLGLAEIHVVGRNPEKLKAFLQSWQHSAESTLTKPLLAETLHVHPWEQLSNLLPQASLIVNTTPIGMYPHVERSPLTSAEAAMLSADVIAYDLTYNPSPTLFLQQAQQQGGMAIDGLEMLVQQGAAALKIWLQQPVPVDVMRRSLVQHLGL